MRAPSTLSTPMARFADALLAVDLPALPVDPRRQTVSFIDERVQTMTSVPRFGVKAIGIGVDILSKLVGVDRVISLVTKLPIPLLAEYWPATQTDGAQ
jgi:hypothetical protein